MCDDIQFLTGDVALEKLRQLGRPYTLLIPFFSEQGMTAGIANAGDCHMELVTMGDCHFPVVINSGKEHACVTLSAYGEFIRAAVEEIRKSPIFPLIRWPAVLGLQCLGLICNQRQLDRCVFINNWGFLTRMKLGYSFSPVEEWLEPVLQRYPECAVLYSVMPERDPEQARDLRKAGFQLIPFRVVYIWEPDKWKASSRSKRQSLSRELRIIQQDSCQTLTEQDDLSVICPREVRQMYRSVYLEKYSSENPDLTVEYFRNLIEEKAVGLDFIKSGEKITGFISWWKDSEQMYALPLGHGDDKKDGISMYRRLMAHDFQRSIESGLPLDLGSGVGHFKKTRGAAPYQEYLAVYDRHMPATQRLAWWMLGTAYRWFAPFFRDKVMG